MKCCTNKVSRNGFAIRLSFFINNVNISGFRYLSNRCSLPGRLFWGVILIISFVGMIKIFELTLKRFQSDSISIGIDTSYLRWVNTFPAVSICLDKGRSSTHLQEFIRSANISYVAKETQFLRNTHLYMYSNPNSLFSYKKDCDGLNSTCGVDIKTLRELFIPKNCSSIMNDLTFNGKTYKNCKDVFKYQETEMGACFIANSIMHHNLDFTKLPLKFGIDAPKVKLSTYLLKDSSWKYSLYIHSPEELPNFNSPSTTLFSEAFSYKMHLEEIDNDANVKELSIEQRACRFPEEILPYSGLHYSYTTCLFELRIKLELEHCNCTLFTSPVKFRDRYCDIKGMDCLEKSMINGMVKQLQSSETHSCLPSCQEQLLSPVGSIDVRELSRSGSIYFDVEIINFPTMRFKRVVTQTMLDLVVSIGGVAGLFFGASVLNIVEIVYIWFVRRYKND